MSEPVLEVEGLSKWYGQVIGLNNISVTIGEGITGLLGPNGAGKSTFMRLVTGQLRPSTGTVRVFGVPIWGNPSAYRDIGVCPDQDAFYERMTGHEWVAALARLWGMDNDDAARAADRALETVRLSDARNKRIGAYSKGMRQRVKLAQALVHDPSLLLLDEPLAGMDPLARRRTIQLVKELARAGKTIVVSSHVLYEIELMTSNVLLLHHGRILAEGNVHQIRELIDEHPHKVIIHADEPRRVARELLDDPTVITMNFGAEALVVETNRPDAFYTRLTELAARGTVGTIDGVISPDDNLQAVFKYLVKQ